MELCLFWESFFRNGIVDLVLANVPWIVLLMFNACHRLFIICLILGSEGMYVAMKQIMSVQIGK